MTIPTTRQTRTFRGTVVSDKMMKTIVVEVARVQWHAKYLRQYRTTKRFKVHDEENAYHVGDVVECKETRPMSKEKRWVVVRKVDRV